MKKFRSSLSFYIFLIILTTFLGSFASAKNLDKYLRKEKLHPKMESILSDLEEEHNKGVGFAKEFSSKRNIKIDERDRITIFIYLERDKPLNMKALEAHGAEIIKGTHDVIKVAVPVGMLKSIANNVEGVRFMKLPDKPVSQVTSQGVGLTGASAYQSAGYSGSGVKIAVIDSGFKKLTDAILSGELPGSIYVFDCTGSGCVNTTFPWDILWEGEEHGTAVAEIVHDMAPGAQLYLMKIDDSLDLLDAKNFCVSNGIKIVNHSVGWYNKNFYDGSCYDSNPVCTVNNAYSNGILWVNAAGNHALEHYQGTFIDSNFDGIHDQLISFFAVAGQKIRIFLTWNAWPYTNQDYDMAVVDSYGNLIALSNDLQTGTQNPKERITFIAPYSDNYYIRILKYSATSNHQLKIFTPGINISPSVSSSSLASPADASGALAVAAINYSNWTTGPQESFSSRGPTTDGRIKPDISGPDMVASYTYGSFPGTSAAAPHVAGAAALILSANPGYSVSQLWNSLTSSAIDMGSPGKDNIYGFGRLNLPTITETVSVPTTPSGPASGTTGNSYSYSTGGSSSNLGHSVQYFFDWGDGTNSGWLPVGTTTASKTWTSAGTYSVKAQARCAAHTSVVSGWSGTLTVNISVPIKPNLTPYNYYGSDKIILTKTPCAGMPNMVDETPFYTTDTLYLAWGVINNGAAPTTVSAPMAIYLDGQLIHTNSIGPLQVSQTSSCCLCASIGPLSAGTHTIRIVVDTTNAIDESNEADNEYTKKIFINGVNGVPILRPYDGFSGTYIDKTKWSYGELVREIDTGTSKLLMKQASPNPVWVTNFPYTEMNWLIFSDPESINAVQSDIAIINYNLTNQGYTRARIGGRWYNDGTPGTGMTGDIWASVDLRAGPGGLTATCGVSKMTNADGTTAVDIASRTFTTVPTMGIPYTLYIGYDGANTFTFKIGAETIMLGPTDGLPPRTGVAKMPFKGIGTRVQIDNIASSGFISSTFDNVFKNGGFYDDFSSSTIDPTKWTTYEWVREISGGKLRLAVRSEGESLSNRVPFPNPEKIKAIKAKITPVAYSNPDGASTHTRLGGIFYNDTGNPTSGYLGDVWAQVGIYGSGTSPFSAQWYVLRNTNVWGTTHEILAAGTFPISISLGTTYEFYIYWDGSAFTFKCNEYVANYIPLTPIYKPNNPSRRLETRILQNGTNQKAFIESYFDDVMIYAPGNLVDFDGDGKTDIAVYRTNTGAWYVYPSGGGSPFGFGWGGDDSDKPVPGDYDGDGKTDIAVYRTNTGAWYVFPSGGGSPYGVGWGGDASDKPAQGDYDGDGKTDIAVYRSNTGAWYVKPSGGGSPYGVGWGGDASDKPTPGDYDGDGKTDIAVYRSSTGAWYVYPSGGGTPYGVGWGGDISDKPTPGDYDGDGKTDIAVYRSSTGAWYVIPSSNPSAPYGLGWGGNPTDKPVPGDYDGDGKTDIAVYRTETGAWYVIPSSNPSAPYGLGWGGNPTDIPVTMNLSSIE